MLRFSGVWLEKYRFGPLEWLWRCLTYWQRVPLRRIEITRKRILLGNVRGCDCAHTSGAECVICDLCAGCCVG